MKDLLDQAMLLGKESPERNAEKNTSCTFDTAKHKPQELLQCVFRSLHSSQEKLSFATLKLLDLLLHKASPYTLNHLYLYSIQRTVSKSLQLHHGNQQLFQVANMA